MIILFFPIVLFFEIMFFWMGDFSSNIFWALWNHRLDFLAGRVSVKEYALIIFFVIVLVVVKYILRHTLKEMKCYQGLFFR